MALLNNRPIGLDGTFECVKNLDYRQMYVVTTQLFTADKSQTMILLIVCNLRSLFNLYKKAVLAKTGLPWSPSLVTLDNKVGAMLAVEEVLGVIPTTCYFLFVSQSLIRNFSKPYGSEIGENACPFVQTSFWI